MELAEKERQSVKMQEARKKYNGERVSESGDERKSTSM